MAFGIFFEHRKLRKSDGESDPSNVTLAATLAIELWPGTQVSLFSSAGQ